MRERPYSVASMSERLRCVRCGEVIGSYEPLVLRLGGRARETSRAAEPDIVLEPGEHFHERCYAAIDGRAGFGGLP